MLKLPPNDISESLQPGVFRLNAGHAAHILQHHRWPGQNNRDRTPGARQHIAVLAELMKRGKWRPRRQIHFARTPKTTYLVDGYHRLATQVLANVEIEWRFEIETVADDAAVGALYYTFDTNLRKRTAEQILNSVAFADELGVTRHLASGVFDAMPLIASRFRTAKSAQDIFTNRQTDLRLELAESYAEEARLYEQCLEGTAGAQLRKRLKLGSVVAVALVTLRHQTPRAIDFWTGVATVEGARGGDPRKLLALKLSEGRIGISRMSDITLFTAMAWNAWFHGRELRQIRTRRIDAVRIDGTPFDGS